jgi:hypothetical protein
MTAERVEFGLPVQALQGAAESGDRFVYTSWFAYLSNTGSNGRPVLTRTQWVYLAKAAYFSGNAVEAWQAWHSPNGGRGHLFLAENVRQPQPVLVADHPPGNGGADAEDSFTVLIQRAPQDVLTELASTEIGLLFLDRTRLRPSGFAVGEHLYTMGLAPGEEVVLEQQSFYQREVTNETTTETETNAENEKTTSWSKDNADVVVGSLTTTRVDGFNAGGNIGFEYAGFKVGANGGTNDNTTNADANSRTDSVKEVNGNTSKNVAKLRDLHKTVFRVATTDRFEQSAKRTIRNPNAHTPIDLHFYKVLQRIRFSQERYGVRLCWTPSLPDPASAFFDVETAMHGEMLGKARASVPKPALPAQPVIDQVPGAQVVGLTPPLTELTGWGGWPGTDMSADYTLPINVPTGMKWDSDKAFLQASLHPTLTGAPRGFHVDPVGDPWEVVNSNGDRTIFQIVHAGAGWRLEGHSQLWVSLSARVIPDAASLAGEQAKATAEWEAKCAAIIAEYNAQVAAAEAQALQQFAVWQADHRASLNPKQELMRRFIGSMFQPDERDTVAELDTWEQIFEWDLMAARLYPGTWNGTGELRDPYLPADDFVNASWARLYLPVRPGYEEIALRWMYLRDKVKTGPLTIEDFIAKVLKDMRDWRMQNLGGPDEIVITPAAGQPCPDVVQRYVCLGTWTEDLPTDGVHTEVTLATTTAADPLTASIAALEPQRISAVIATTVAEGKVEEAVAAADVTDVAVRLDVGGK